MPGSLIFVRLFIGFLVWGYGSGRQTRPFVRWQALIATHIDALHGLGKSFETKASAGFGYVRIYQPSIRMPDDYRNRFSQVSLVIRIHTTGKSVKSVDSCR